MSFLSFSFAIFLGGALLLFHLAPARWRPGLLLGFSYAFYLTWSVWHTLLLGAVTAGVYATALWIEGQRSERGKRTVAALGVISLLVLMFAFKAAGWFIHQFHLQSGSQGATGAALVVLVPLGLSYYVFKTIGYLLDVYWEVMPAQRNFVSVALYGAFFPQIVSGPIQRAESFFQQIDRIKAPDANEFIIGLRRILFGLAKKILIADNLGTLVGNVHANPSGFSPLELLAGAYCYAIQLYTDFSGITDIAIGVGLLFGVKGPENFDLPFLAPNIQLYWRRWHMSLTTWLTDYLFTPLRMSLRNWGTAGLWLAILINLTAIGLWHGLAWTFLAFGIIHGIYMIGSVQTLKQRNRFFQKRPGLARLRVVAAPLWTFHMVVFALIFFRAETFRSSLDYLAALGGAQASTIPLMRFDPTLLGMSLTEIALCAVAFLASEALVWTMRRHAWSDVFQGMQPCLRRAAYCALVAAVLLMFKGKVAFIYAGF